MTRPAQPFPKGPYEIVIVDGCPCIVDAAGNDLMATEEGMKRLVDCANAIGDKVWFPIAHVAALQDRCERLEQLRKEACAMADAIRFKGEAA